MAQFEPTPCAWCNELIAAGDLRHALIDQMHYACALRSVMGSIAHLEKRCCCYVPGSTAEDPVDLTTREAAQLVADYVRAHPELAAPLPERPLRN